MFEEKTETKYVQTKLKKVEKQYSIKKLLVLQGLKIVEKIVYVSVALQRIQLSKALFLLDIEEGSEVLIPKDLS